MDYNKNVKYNNGYRVIFVENYNGSHGSAWFEQDGWVYEHVYLIERELDRPLTDDEVVHHLDCNPINNKLNNLIVLPRASHNRLHAWINRGPPIHKDYTYGGENPKFKQINRDSKYCKICSLTLQAKQKFYCSEQCRGQDNRKVEHPSKEELSQLLSENSMCALGRMFGVSDNAVRKWARQYELI